MHQATIISRKEKRAMFGRVTLPNIAVYLTVNFAMFFHIHPALPAAKPPPLPKGRRKIIYLYADKLKFIVI